MQVNDGEVMREALDAFAAWINATAVKSAM
jgi:hypothetical protein